MSGLIPASRVPKSKVQRIYTTDALGILDEELIDEVGWALWSKYDSLFTVSTAHYGSVLCPASGKAINHPETDLDAPQEHPTPWQE